MNLIDLGWNDHLEQHFDKNKDDSLIPARIAVQQKDRYVIFCETGEFQAEVSGKFRYETSSKADFPTIGDWVAIAHTEDETSAVIHRILPRKSKFSRKAVMGGGETDEQVLSANIDMAFIVAGLDGEYNLRRLERYVAVTWDSDASPVIILNKSDLCEELDQVVSEVESTIIGVPVHPVSAVSNDGLDRIREYFGKGITISFLGSSGVGKSTLINSLLGHDRQKTGDVRDYDKKGRHTTTYRELIILPEGGVLIDTPGMREIEMWGDEDGLSKAFDDIEELASGCRFGDCKHENEPGCVIQEALSAGELDKGRYKNYLKMHREIERLEIRKIGKQAHTERLRGKKFASMVKEMKRLKDRYKR
ncbi:MAG: ribosome small subunit-dependent GTPase A [candidate division Zixibacteria bacterium]